MAQMPIQPNNNQKRKITTLAHSGPSGVTTISQQETPQFAQIRLSDELPMANGTTVISADGVAYRLVQFPTETFQTHQIVTANQPSQTHILNAEDLQQLMSNTTFVTSGQQLQLHSNDQQANQQAQSQFYMVMGSGELLQTPNQQTSLQPAAFIPITKLELPQQTTSVIAQSSGQNSQGKNNWSSNRTTTSPQVVKEVKRRCSHNEVEKRRRDKINNWIMKLAKLVPLAEEETTKQTVSKGAILSKTVDYLVELQSAHSALISGKPQSDPGEVEKLQNEVLFLKAENIYLRKLLADANVPAASSSEIQTEYDSQAHQQNGLNKRAKVEGKTSSSDDNNSEDNSSL